MSLTQIESICTNCTFQIIQEINLENPENYIHCPCCDNVFEYSKLNEQNKSNINNQVTQLTQTQSLAIPTKQNLILQNLEQAYEEIPHTFIKSDSIFMKGYINGLEMHFLLDTGAETSILPYDLVNACGLDNVIDTNYSGIIKGVGETKMIGRIYYVEVVFDCGVYPCAFTVCHSDNIPPILGIDMMHNLGLSLDFKKKKINFSNDCSIDFISRKHQV